MLEQTTIASVCDCTITSGAVVSLVENTAYVVSYLDNILAYIQIFLVFVCAIMLYKFLVVFTGR